MRSGHDAPEPPNRSDHEDDEDQWVIQDSPDSIQHVLQCPRSTRLVRVFSRMVTTDQRSNRNDMNRR